MLKPFLAGLAGLGLMAPGALADETRDPEAAGRYWFQAAEVCIQAGEDTEVTPEEQVKLCSELLNLMKAKFDQPDYAPQSPYEANFYWFARGAIQAQLQGAFGEIDGVRSKRVCERVEAQAAAFAKIDNTAWPQDYRDMADRVNESVEGPLKRCRHEFPAG
ncbi:hypothetical protein [Henriciella aquimarina]|uniref:hypothetical protein n=1 Tax=Henriciella aquimarina TaxID=545261 RepID=UPI0009FE7A3D|nr:hypothetical protein [Henriciella aquimarina]